MQSEVIDDILSVEDEAARIIENAQKKARETVSQAHDRAAAIIAKAVDSVREAGKADVAAAEELLRSHLKEYEEERERLLNEACTVDPSVLDRAAGRIVERICSIDRIGA